MKLNDFNKYSEAALIADLNAQVIELETRLYYCERQRKILIVGFILVAITLRIVRYLSGGG